MEQLFVYLGIWSNKIFSWADIVGLCLFIAGFIIGLGFAGISFIHAVLAIVLILNGTFLSFWVSPRLLMMEKDGKARELLPLDLQMKIAMSFIISFFGWWSSLFLLVWYIVVLR
jgi:hypothetical protein